MIKLNSAAQLARAIELAKASRLFVQTTSCFRTYRVTNRASGSTYTVKFSVENGSRYADCTCRAGINRIACKHVAAAAGLHVIRAAQRQASKRQTTH